MNAERLLAHFERISEAQDAVARLRRFILDLAVRGKLVEQDPEDEPAEFSFPGVPSKNRGGGHLSAAIPYSLPPGWTWRAVSAITKTVTDGEHATPKRIEEPDVPLVTAKNVREGYMDYSKTDWVSRETALKAWSRCRPQVGDLLMVCVGATTGRLTVLREARDMVLVRSVALIRPSIISDSDYLEYAIRSPVLQSQIWASVKAAAQPCLYLNRISSLLIPLPPLAEQHRIVAKVDELMALCDQLEAARQQREQVRERMMAATLQRLNQPAEDTASFHQDASFALQVLPSLTTTPAQIKQLRQTILNLAARGKLVEQDPEDEPAEELLASIAFERVKAVQLREMKAPRPVASYDGDREYELPCGWAWSQLGLISAVEDGAMCDGPFGSKLKTEHYISKQGFAVVRLGNIGIGEFLWGKEGHISREHFESLPGNHIRPGDLLIAGLADPLVRCCEAPANLGPAVNKADCFRLRLHPLINRYFVSHYLNSPVAKSFAAEENHGMTRERINLANAKSIPIPLPPLAEQHRIVARVDELMALCDQLEQQLSQADQQRRRLLEAVLAEALVEPEKTLEASYA